jgi:hypothetical protein
MYFGKCRVRMSPGTILAGWKCLPTSLFTVVHRINQCNVTSLIARATAQAFSSRFLTVAARVRVKLWSCRIFGWRSGTGAGFLRVLRFPVPIRIPPIAP